jgi:hypothetical protein
VNNDGRIVEGNRSSQDAGWVGSDKLVMNTGLTSSLYIVMEGNSMVLRRKVFYSHTRKAVFLWSGRLTQDETFARLCHLTVLNYTGPIQV